MPIRSCLQTVLAQKDQLLETCPGVRLGKPIMVREIERLTATNRGHQRAASRSKPKLLKGAALQPGSPNKSSLYDVKTEQAVDQKSAANLYANDHLSSQHHPKGLVEPDGIEPTTSCLQSRRSPS